MKKVALIQSKVVFTPKLKAKYFNNIPFLTSTNLDEIYKFIKKNFKKHRIYKYVLYVNSALLTKFIDYLYDKKKQSEKARKMLSKCILVATYSNADTVRQQNVDKKTNIYFGSSPISEVLTVFNGLPSNRLMLVVSDSENPYFHQVYNNSPVTPKYYLSELTVDIINDFQKTGSNISIFLDTPEEYNKLVELISQSNYVRQLTIIEIEYPNLLRPLFTKLSSITAIGSGVGLAGDVSKYNDLNNFLMYENNTVSLVNLYKQWEKLIENSTISKDPAANYNKTATYNLKDVIV